MFDKLQFVATRQTKCPRSATNGSLSNEKGREFDSFDHAAVIGNPAAGDVKGRAVIDRSPDYGQPKRYVNSVAECEALDRNQSLIVITGGNSVKLAPQGAQEQFIGGPRTRDVDVVFC